MEALCPAFHSHPPFMWKWSLINWRECQLPTLSCLEEQQAVFFVQLMVFFSFSPHSSSVLILKAVVLFSQNTNLPSQQSFFVRVRFFSLFSERLSIWCNNSENKLRVYNTVLVLELILVSWCIILHPASDLESCQSLCLNQLVLMALPLHRSPLWWWPRN